MATIAREAGWSVIVYTHDHPPPHAHVSRKGKKGDVRVGLEGGSVWLYSSDDDYSVGDVRDALALVESYRPACLTAWGKFNANP